MSEPWITSWLGAVAFLAGLVDAVVGGGGLVQLPALFVVLPAEHVAQTAAVLGTNKLSSICGTSMAVWQYTRRVPLNWRTLFPTAMVALAGSLLGARAVSLMAPAVLRPLILVLLVAVAIYTFLRKDLGDLHAPRFTADRERRLGAVVGAVIGFYDGFFGPGTGSFLIFALIGLFGFDFLAASASAKVVNLATNLSAVAYFAATDNLLYRYGLPMAVCNMAGGLVGARLAILKGNRFVRGFFLVVVSAMILRFGWEVVRGQIR